MTHWGIVATVKAPLCAIQRFAAWHLDQGAHRIYLYLDDDPDGARERLAAHPRLRVTVTGEAYWARRGGRPAQHQARQSVNARHAANRKPDCAWLAHIDVDEFLLPARPIAAQLAALPDSALCARVRPVEALAPGSATSPGETLFKAFHLDQHARARATARCFPGWADHLSGGFLSHVAGKLFFRTGRPGWQIRIHNVFLAGVQNPGEIALDETELGHFHAPDWAHFHAHYRFRLAKGSYRDALRPQARSNRALNLHNLFRTIEARGGEPALAQFFDEVCTANTGLCDRLAAEGLLRRHCMNLRARAERHFGTKPE